MVAPKILVIDDEKNIRRTLSLVLTGEGYEVQAFESARQALHYLEEEDADLVICDVKMPDMDGVEALRAIRASTEHRDLPVIMISGHASLSDAVATVKAGATDFFEKPLDRDAILVRVANCLKQKRLAAKVDELQRQVAAKHEIIGRSKAIADLMEQIAKVAPTKSRVLIVGESGTGKELVARAIHEGSARKQQPFIKVNCAAIPGELIESELFGHEKGAFTGATARKPGQFELADGGTLFLDEIGDMSLNAQAKVLRALQSGEITRVGGQKTIRVDVRVVAATNRDLEAEVAAGRFREDLYFRLNVVLLRTPPLRERVDDIPLLLTHFIDAFCKENGYHAKPISDQVMDKLCAYSWPGNVRELRNVAERLVIMSGSTIEPSDLPDNIAGLPGMPRVPRLAGERLTLREFRERAEREYILATLEETGWNISSAATILGVERTNLHKKIKALGIERR